MAGLFCILILVFFLVRIGNLMYCVTPPAQKKFIKRQEKDCIPWYGNVPIKCRDSDTGGGGCV